MRVSVRSIALLLGLLVSATAHADPKPLEFEITFAKNVSSKPFTGRVYVLLTKVNGRTSPPPNVNWFNPEPMFAKDVKDWKPGEKIVVDKSALGYPMKLDKLTPGDYTAFAVMDFDRGYIGFSAAPGNGYSKPLRAKFDPATSGAVALTIDQVAGPEREFKETDRVKLVDIESKLLSDFHKRPVHLRAGVILPESYNDLTNRKRDMTYPVVYEIPGFGGDHFGALNMARRNPTNVAGVEMLYVVLDPNCRTGHHVFADSANNGPCGQALIEELIPYIEKKFSGKMDPRMRFVTGHSSGGWSSLWLQVTYPDHFNGVWSTAPDPVDFRDFQRIDLSQKGVNMFKDADGKLRPLARRNGQVMLIYKNFSDMETVMGHGGQLSSFEAVFSPRGPDGQPLKLWDRTTGAVDPEVAKSWEPYDIRLKLEKNWKTLEPKLAGKLHVYMGDEDTFYLDGAARLLQKSLKSLGSDAVVEMFPGKDHGSLVDAQLRQRIAKEMAERVRTAR